MKKEKQNVVRTWSCIACKSHKYHQLDACTIFLDMPIKEKYEILRKGGFCYLCLSKGHIASQCEIGSNCSECGWRHHVVLHQDYNDHEAVLEPPVDFQ